MAGAAFPLKREYLSRTAEHTQRDRSLSLNLFSLGIE